MKGKRIGAAPWVEMGLRQLLAEGHPWDDELMRAISPVAL